MKKRLLATLVAGLVLLALSYALLFGSIQLMPALIEEFYNPIFWPGEDRAILFFIHPFLIAYVLAWFWQRFQQGFRWDGWQQAFELGFIYAFVATLPSMWITFSALDVSISMVATWFFYGGMQATVAGFVFWRMKL